MTELDGLRIPAAVRPVAEEIIGITDKVCLAHLDGEYAELCRKLTATLARKHPSPLLRGQRRIWAGGVIYASGRINFLFDPAQTPHLRADQLAEHIGVKQILDTLDLGLMEPEYLREELLASHPLLSLVEVNDILVDVRALPESLQALADQPRQLPDLPAHGEPRPKDSPR